MSEQQTLIHALARPERFSHPVDQVDIVETHISWVLLAGEFAYKIKKPVDLGFLDFSTLARRKYFCEEELRLNRRLAEDLYLDVVSITGSVSEPGLDGDGPALEYAVKMRRFDQRLQLDHLLERGELDDAIVDRLAARVSAFHTGLPRAGADDTFGEPEQIWAPVEENFTQIHEALHEGKLQRRLQRLRRWSEQHYQDLIPVFAQRKREGYIRECHGDMHLRNIALFRDEVVVFDGIEFSEALRWIDVISEIAFLIMDLQDRSQARLAQRFLDRYLEHTGDYAGLRVLRFYQVYRALVRAKVDAIRLGQDDVAHEERTRIHADLDGYVSLAESYMQTSHPMLLINHGLSGSGKTFYSQMLLEQLPAIRLRSDVERKRVFSADDNASGQQGINEGLYSPEISARLYRHLQTLSALLLESGYSVIVDAAFLQRARRKPFEQLARQHNVPLLLLHYSAAPSILRERVARRSAQGADASDADMAVLENQLAQYEELDEAEEHYTLHIATDENPDMNAIIKKINEKAGGND